MTEPAATTLEANTPYLYLPNATADVDFGGAYTIPRHADGRRPRATAGPSRARSRPSSGQPLLLAPTASRHRTKTASAWVQFVQVGDYVRIKPLRCYLENASFAGARGMTRAAAEPLPETIKVRLISANGEVTGIGTISTKTGEGTIDSGAWYSLDGRRIVGKPSVKGIYVNNGNKVIIK